MKFIKTILDEITILLNYCHVKWQWHTMRHESTVAYSVFEDILTQAPVLSENKLVRRGLHIKSTRKDERYICLLTQPTKNLTSSS